LIANFPIFCRRLKLLPGSQTDGFVRKTQGTTPFLMKDLRLMGVELSRCRYTAPKGSSTGLTTKFGVKTRPSAVGLVLVAPFDSFFGFVLGLRLVRFFFTSGVSEFDSLPLSVSIDLDELGPGEFAIYLLIFF
jgi:hypothetical protein